MPRSKVARKLAQVRAGGGTPYSRPHWCAYSPSWVLVVRAGNFGSLLYEIILRR